MFSMKRLFIIVIIFFLTSGMKIILKDGNFLEVANFHIGENYTQVNIRREKINIPNYLIDLKSTIKLYGIEKRGLSIVKSYSSLIYDNKDNYKEMLKAQKEEKKELKNIPKIKVETRKDTNPFFMELPDIKSKDEDFVDKIKKKGIIFKFNVPVEK